MTQGLFSLVALSRLALWIITANGQPIVYKFYQAVCKAAEQRDKDYNVETSTSDAVIYLGDGASVAGFFIDSDGFPSRGVSLTVERLDDRVQLPLPMAGFGKVANSVNRLMHPAVRAAASPVLPGWHTGRGVGMTTLPGSVSLT